MNTFFFLTETKKPLNPYTIQLQHLTTLRLNLNINKTINILLLFTFCLFFVLFLFILNSYLANG